MINLNESGIKPILHNRGTAPFVCAELNETLAPGAAFDMLTRYLTLEDAQAAIDLPDGTIRAGLVAGQLEVEYVRQLPND